MGVEDGGCRRFGFSIGLNGKCNRTPIWFDAESAKQMDREFLLPQKQKRSSLGKKLGRLSLD
ncbi:hypothetical protein CKA34_11550 [Rhizobium sp. 11515TR]|nr:hypothetical protein CKA34_11550 [Rhizobium sp. 11515TR]